MSWRGVEHITIYREEGWYGAHPNLIRTPAGDLLVLFHRSPYVGYSHHSHPLFDVRACRSEDEGQTWSEQHFITADPLGGVLDFGTHALSDGSIFLHASNVELVPQDEEREGGEWIARAGIPFWVRSRDDGRTWTEPVRFPPLPDAVWGHPATHSGIARSGVIQMPDGRLLLPSKATDHPDGAMPFFGMLRVSRDMGETWEYGGRIAEDPVTHFSEPAIYLTAGGRIIVLFRCHPGPGVASREVCLALVESTDGGETWPPWRQTTIRGCPGHMLGLRDGRIFTTVGTRWSGQRGCLARILEPEGSDLDTAPALVIRSDSHDSDCGYPWSVELEDGLVLVVYYYVYSDGHRGIEGTIVEEVS